MKKEIGIEFYPLLGGGVEVVNSTNPHLPQGTIIVSVVPNGATDTKSLATLFGSDDWESPQWVAALQGAVIFGVWRPSGDNTVSPRLVYREGDEWETDPRTAVLPMIAGMEANE